MSIRLLCLFLGCASGAATASAAEESFLKTLFVEVPEAQPEAQPQQETSEAIAEKAEILAEEGESDPPLLVSLVAYVLPDSKLRLRPKHRLPVIPVVRPAEPVREDKSL